MNQPKIALDMIRELVQNKDRGSRNDDIQQNRILLLRNLRPKYFTAADGETLATTVRAWFRAREDETGPLSEERELVDWEYRIAPDGTHHLWIFYAE